VLHLIGFYERGEYVETVPCRCFGRRIEQALDFCEGCLIISLGFNGMDVHSSILSNGGGVNPIVVLVRSNKTDVDNAVGVVEGHHKTILIAPDVEDYAVVAHKARITIHSSDVCGGSPGGTLGITIPCLYGLLCIRVPFPKETECFEGNNMHAAIIQRSRIGNNGKAGRLTLKVIGLQTA
jgi:hypothetical protein